MIKLYDTLELQLDCRFSEHDSLFVAIQKAKEFMHKYSIYDATLCYHYYRIKLNI